MRNTPSIGMARGRAPLPRPLGHRGAGLPSTSALEPSAEAQLRRKAKIRIGRPYPGAVNQAFTQGIGRPIDRSTTCLSRAARLDSRPCASLQFSKEEGSTERKGRGGGERQRNFSSIFLFSLSQTLPFPLRLISSKTTISGQNIITNQIPEILQRRIGTVNTAESQTDGQV